MLRGWWRWGVPVRALRGNGNAAIFLSQLVSWGGRLGDDEGWFYQSQRRLEQQTGWEPMPSGRLSGFW